MKDNVEVMKSTFEHAMKFEQYVNLWTRALNLVDAKLQENKNREQDTISKIETERAIIQDAEGNWKTYSKNSKKLLNKYIRRIVITVSIIVILLGFTVFFTLMGKDDIASFFFLPFAVGFGPLVFIAFIGYNVIACKQAKKEVDMFNNSEKEKQMQISHNNINSYNLFLEKTRKERVILTEKRQSIVAELNEAKNTLKSIYDLELIPKEYRGLVPVSTMYGYLISLRCTTICGHGGVYDTYVHDCQMGLIIQNLIDMNKKLDIVIRNQEKLYKAIQEVNSQLSSIQREIEYGNKQLSEINQNTAIAAAASSQTAALISYQNWRDY